MYGRRNETSLRNVVADSTRSKKKKKKNRKEVYLDETVQLSNSSTSSDVHTYANFESWFLNLESKCESVETEMERKKTEWKTSWHELIRAVLIIH